MRFNTLILGATVVPAVLAAQSASAVTFTYDTQSAGGNTNVGIHKSITTTYNTRTDFLTWSSTFAVNPNNGQLADGAWLVLSDGANPKYNEQKYTMFYLDGNNARLTAYTYNGVNGSDSWADSESVFLDSWALDVSDNAAGTERTLSFGIDMTDINTMSNLGPAWEGTFFEEKVGIWFHGVANVNAQYNADGTLSQFGYESQGWYDTANRDTKQAPEPGFMAGVGGAAAIMGVLRRKRLKANSEG